MVDQDQRTQAPGGRFNESREGFANHPHLANDTDTSATGDYSATPQGATRNDNMGRFGRAREAVNRGMDQLRSSDMLNRVTTQARTNPWVQIGLAGVGGLFLGYIVGKSSLGGSFSNFMASSESEDIEDDL